MMTKINCQKEVKASIRAAVLMSTFFFVSFTYAAGDISSGGGNAVVCYDEQEPSRIISAELLDLFEGKNRFNFSIVRNETPVGSQIKSMVQKLKTNTTQEIKAIDQIVEKVKKDMRFLSPGVGLGDLDDYKSDIILKGCKFKQLARYFSTNELLVDQDIWTHLPQTDKAALYIHEALYLISREGYGAKNSDRVRKMVAYLFGYGELENADDGVPNQFDLCWSNDGNAKSEYKFYYYDGILQFISFEGTPAITKTVLGLKHPIIEPIKLDPKKRNKQEGFGMDLKSLFDKDRFINFGASWENPPERPHKIHLRMTEEGRDKKIPLACALDCRITGQTADGSWLYNCSGGHIGLGGH